MCSFLIASLVLKWFHWNSSIFFVGPGAFCLQFNCKCNWERSKWNARNPVQWKSNAIREEEKLNDAIYPFVISHSLCIWTKFLYRNFFHASIESQIARVTRIHFYWSIQAALIASSWTQISSIVSQRSFFWRLFSMKKTTTQFSFSLHLHRGKNSNAARKEHPINSALE